MRTAKIHFEQNIERVKHLGAIYKSINNQTTSILDISDILRAQYVMLVSALDHFIHEVVRIGMIETYNNSRKPTKTFKEFILSIPEEILFKKAIMEVKNNQWLDYQIRHRNGFKSFQRADKIGEAILLIKDIKLWDEIEDILGTDSKILKKKLNLIVERRNQIAHEADIEPTYQTLRNIESRDINDSIEFIENLVRAIYQICELPSH